jgi:hypothetical protein
VRATMMHAHCHTDQSGDKLNRKRDNFHSSYYSLLPLTLAISFEVHERMGNHDMQQIQVHSIWCHADLLPGTRPPLSLPI